jgi:hypothetical protein
MSILLPDQRILAASSLVIAPIEKWVGISEFLTNQVHKADCWTVPEGMSLFSMEGVGMVQRFAETYPIGLQKVAILTHAENWRAEVANALLKLLEEPPAYLTLVLLAERERVLPTVRSRLQVYQVGENASSVWNSVLDRSMQRGGEGRIRAKDLLYLMPLFHATSNPTAFAESVTHELTFL